MHTPTQPDPNSRVVIALSPVRSPLSAVEADRSARSPSLIGRLITALAASRSRLRGRA